MNSSAGTVRVTLFVALVFIAGVASGASADKPSRPADKNCRWEKFSDPGVGLQAWVQRCDYGDRKIDFLAQGRSLAIRYSDAGAKPDPLVDVFDLLPREDARAAIGRVFLAHTDEAVAARCVLAPYKEEGKVRTGVERYTFVPDRKYQKELDAKRDPNEVGDPPCGDWGDAPDGVQYFEAQPSRGVRRILFVRVGQDIPLFDENTLKPLPLK
jgi:hypothetical protein